MLALRSDSGRIRGVHDAVEILARRFAPLHFCIFAGGKRWTVAACPDRAAYSHAERIPQASHRCLFTAQEYRYEFR